MHRAVGCGLYNTFSDFLLISGSDGVALMCYDTIFFHSYKSIVNWYVRRLSRESVVGSAAERTHITHLAAHLRPLA